MKLNRKLPPIQTHEGGKASRCNMEEQLRRSVLACLLWERTFYENGINIAERIKSNVNNVSPEFASQLAIQARSDFNLRHAPLWICSTLAKNRTLKADTLASVIQRADELTEFLAMYWKDGKCSLSAQVKKGLAKAFTKFDAYQLAKYNRPNAIKLRDVMFLVHPKPKDREQGRTFTKLADGILESPDTWESALVGGKDKKETFERLLIKNKLGYMALLKNLRNMRESGVDEELVFVALNRGYGRLRILPFRFISAARTNPYWEEQIEKAMLETMSQMPKLPGKTIFIIDVSGSMYGGNISKYSEMDRATVACSLAIPIRELCEKSVIYATAGNDFSQIHDTRIVPARHGFALADAIYKLCRPLGGGGIFLKQVMDYIKQEENEADRIIVITDEQDCDHSSLGAASKADAFGKNNYIINVASYENGIGYSDKWVHITGFSEAIIKFIQESESGYQQMNY